MNLPGNGIFVVRGELNSIMTSMKRYQRNSWNYQYDNSDNLTKKFNSLKERLNKIEDLKLLEPEDFLTPFLEAIRSEDVPGVITSVALSSVNKFLSYGLIDPTNTSKMNVVQNIADAVTHARFVGGDNNSDGVVLLRIVQVLKTLMLSPEGNFLTNESVCEIILSCFRICFEMRLNELLRKSAEQALRDMIHLLFMRLPQFTEDLDSSTLNHLKIRSDQVKTSKSKSAHWNEKQVQKASEKSVETDTVQTPTEPTNASVESEPLNSPITHSVEEVTTEENPEPKEPVAQVDDANSSMEDSIKLSTESEFKPYGIACIRELFRFLISLCNPLDQHNTENVLHIALDLLTVVFEVSSDNLASYHSLIALVKDELCRNLFSLIQTEKINLIASSLRLNFLLFESLRFHLKLQLEYYLIKLMDIITTENPNPRFTHEIKELALENIMQLLQIPGFAAEVYINYDCDLYCDDIFEKLTKLLSKNVLFTYGGIYSVNGIQVLSLEALLAIIGSINKNCELVKIGNRISFNKRHSRNNSLSRPEDFKSDESVIDGKFPKYNRYNSIVARFSEKIKLGEAIDDKKIEGLRNRKRVLAQGTEHFNQKPEKGISFLQENGILNVNFDNAEVALFLRESPGLDKKMIGEYISKKKNVEKGILDAYVKSFDFCNLRIDKALRLYLETFRLPGEAPLIFLVMEQFASHFHSSHTEPFANPDAAFRLAYAIIMLNMDQHNHNAKKLNVPMTVDDFIKNLRGLNGSSDFDQQMLTDIYNSIKNEEIVMPAEQTGLVRENYLWKVLLRRGETKDGEFLHAFDATYDKHLFQISWGSTLSALGSLFDKVTEIAVIKKVMEGFIESASISSSYNLHEEFDAIVLTLCKFTTLYNMTETNMLQMSVQFGTNSKARTAMKSVFKFVHDFGDSLRDSWKHVINLVIQLYKLNLLPKILVEVEDVCDSTTKIRLQYEPLQVSKAEGSLFSSLYSYLSSEGQRQPSAEEQEVLKVARKCIKDCQIEQIVVETRFLHTDSLNEVFLFFQSAIKPPTSHSSVGEIYEENLVVFHLELFIKIIIQNRDRVLPLWPLCNEIFHQLIINSASCGYSLLLKRASMGLFKLAVYLMRNEDLASTILQSLKVFLELKPNVQNQLAIPISIGMFEVLKTSAQNMHTESDWSIVFSILECFGAGVVLKDFDPVTKSDGAVSSEEEAEVSDRGYTSDSELLKSSSPPNDSNWIIVDKNDHNEKINQINSIVYECKLIKHSPAALVKCWDSLAFIVRNVAHITPYNFELCVKCIRIFVEASMTYGRKQQSHKDKLAKRSKKTQMTPSTDDTESPEINERYQAITIQLLDLMHTLHTRTAQIFRWWAEEGGATPHCESALWIQGWCPLLQGIARISTDYRKQVRTSAITCLQRALLMHDLQTLTGKEWAGCFKFVLFPLMSFLLKETTENNGTDPNLIEESRIRVSTIVSKVFLHHLTPLMTLENFNDLWLEVLKFMEAFMKLGLDMLYEAVLESLKNLLLVMYSVKAFHNPDGLSYSTLWDLTWSRIDTFHPTLKAELFKIDETPIVNKLQLNHEFLASPHKPVENEKQIPEIKFQDPSKDSSEQSSPVEIINEPEIIPESITPDEHVECITQQVENLVKDAEQSPLKLPEPESIPSEMAAALESHMNDADIERFSETSSIELVIQGGLDNQISSMPNITHVPFQHPPLGNIPNSIMQSFPPFAANVVSNTVKTESDIFYDYVNNPYNLTLQYEASNANTLNDSNSSSEARKVNNFFNAPTDSTMFQSSSYFNANDARDLMFMDGSNPQKSSSKHELFDQQP